MTGDDLLTVLERLFKAAQHPDVTRVERFDGALHGVAAIYTSGAKAFFSVVTDRAQTQQADMPADLGPWKVRTHHALKLLLDLLEVAQPAGWKWRTVNIAGVPKSPSGIEFTDGAGTVLVRVTAGGPMALDSDPADWAGWTIPADVSV